MEVAYRREPVKTLRGMQPAKATDIRAAIARIAINPFALNNNIKPLKGVTNGIAFASATGGYHIRSIARQT